MDAKMSSLMDLVAQNQPRFQTHQALLVIGLQNDFVLPDGRLPVNVNKGFLERIQALIPKFRELNGNVIWVQTLYEADRIANDADTGEGDALVVGGLVDGDESGTEGGDDELAKEVKNLPPAQSRSAKHKQRAKDLLKRVSARRKTIPREVARASAERDEELFLFKSEKKTPACVPDTFGAQFADVIARQFELPADMVIRTTHYSAFQGTNLLMTLRAKLVTELYICGCITNVSVLATVIDAARHGVKINVVEDCLGFRKQARHDLALKRMDEFFDAYLVNSTEILAREPPVTPPQKQSTSPNGSRKSSKASEKPIDALMGKMSLSDEGRPASRTSNPRSPTKVLSGKQRTLSLVSFAENRRNTQTAITPIAEPLTEPAIEPMAEPTDKQFADMLVQGARRQGTPDLPSDEKKEKPNLVKTKIRMRSKQKKKKKKEEGETSKAESGPPAQTGAEPATATATPASHKTPQTSLEAQRTSLIAKAGSVADLRDKEIRQQQQQQALKSVASVPVLSAKVAGSEEKERNRLSDLSDRVRLSFSRAPKSSESTTTAAESRKGLNSPSGSLKAAFSPVKSENKKSKRLPVKVSEAKNLPPLPAQTIISKAPETPRQSEDRQAKQLPARPSEPITAKSPPQVPVQAPVDPQPATVQPPTRPAPTPPVPITKSPAMPKVSKLQNLATLPVLGPLDKIAEGDSRIIYDFFPADRYHPSAPSKPLTESIFTDLYNEVRWQKMLHQTGEVPRLVCCQGAFGDDGAMPVYRHPTDQTLPLLHFSPKVQVIRRQAEKLVGHPLNHVLIQLYRSGNDYISEHSDKTLDIVKESSIVNVSFGAQRTMRLRTKKPDTKADQTDTTPATTEDAGQRETQRVAMPHNSMFVLGLDSNAKWLHGIMADKRLASERSAAETAYNGIRISLTFRHIGTFLDARENTIWGQGATAKEQRDAADVVNGEETENERLIRAFSRENHSSDFDWEAQYGEGFDVLHIKTAPADVPILFAATNPVETRQVQMCLAEAKIQHTLIDAPPLESLIEGVRRVTWRDNDVHHSQVGGADAVLTYLDRWYPLDKSDAAKPTSAAAHFIIRLATHIELSWDAHNSPSFSDDIRTEAGGEVKNAVAELESHLAIEGGPFIAGRRFGIADCLVWPLIDDLVVRWDGWSVQSYPVLTEYYRALWKKKACVKKIRDKLPEVRKTDKVEVVGQGKGKQVEAH